MNSSLYSPKLFLLLLVTLLAAVIPSFAATPLAILKSAKNADTYQNQNLGTFDEDWLSFKRTLEAANLRYDQLSDDDLKSSRLSQYKLVMVPFLVDIGQDQKNSLREFVKNGGKLLITDGGGNPSETAVELAAIAGAVLKDHSTIQEQKQLSWKRTSGPYIQDFAVGTLIADLDTANGGTCKAKWIDGSGNDVGVAITSSGGNNYLSWAPGLQGEISTNAQIISYLLDDSVSGLVKDATIQISSNEYSKSVADLEQLQFRTENAMALARQADLAVPFKTIQKHYESALAHVRTFRDFYSQGKFYEADGELSAARTDFSLAFAQSMPVRDIEARSIWLDRGTIVACQDPAGMTQLFDRLKKSGINVVYFETNNAGFTMYPSSLATQNPQTKSWDPLKCAVMEAHKRGMELHAWFWIFNVGNTYHNPIIGQDADYPGPVLSKNVFSLALAAQNGSFIPPKQHEFWLDPCLPESREYIRKLLAEATQKYDLDGVQLDYIRYPFNGKGGEMGFDWSGRVRFERETGLSLDRLQEKTRQAFIKWKTQQISSFVQETSSMLRRLKPGIRISAAVYAMPRDGRLQSIQQDWETWVKNGWVDTINPMTYVSKGSELTKMAGYVKDSSENRALVFPGLFIKDLDTAGFVEQLDISRSLGTLGNTMFAVAQLDEKKSNILALGPYRKSPLMTPQSNPVRAAQLLFDNFAAAIFRYVQDPERPIVSDRAATNDVLSQVETLQRQMRNLGPSPKPEQLEVLSANLSSLQTSVKDWLSIETFAKRAPRAQYISAYLNETGAILSYALHKAKSEKLTASK